MALDWYDFRCGAPIFRTNQSRSRPPRWGVSVITLDGTLQHPTRVKEIRDRQEKEEKEYVEEMERLANPYRCWEIKKLN